VNAVELLVSETLLLQQRADGDTARALASAIWPASSTTSTSRDPAKSSRDQTHAVPPIHAELRLNERGPWLVELAGRSIGGLCSRILRFGVANLALSLEELILRQAFNMPIDSTQPPASLDEAGGVMMIPIPRAGLFVGCQGLETARAIPWIESIEITAKRHYPIYPLPEGESYLGFIFAHAETPREAEAALRAAHAQLRLVIDRDVPVI